MPEPETLDAWIEWKRLCALGLCSEGTQTALRAFGRTRFARFMRAYAPHLLTAASSPAAGDERDAWHLFETHLTVPKARGGKRYKDWLFARTEGTADSALDVIQGGATLLMRDVVREHLRREYTPAAMVSLDRPVCESDGVPLTLHDLLPGSADPAQEAELREYARLAREQALLFLAGMSEREKVAVLAKDLGLSLAHPAAEEAARCRKSVLNTAYGEAMRRLLTRIRDSFSSEDDEAVRVLALRAVDELRDAVRVWARSENSCAQLFMVAGN